MATTPNFVPLAVRLRQMFSSTAHDVLLEAQHGACPYDLAPRAPGVGFAYVPNVISSSGN